MTRGGVEPRPRSIYGPVSPLNWTSVADEVVTEQLQELREWVEWTRWRFALDQRTIPDCWDQHGAIVEELSALYSAWQNAYNYTDDGDAPLRWMSQFAAARDRLRDWTSRHACRPGSHRAERT